ncbi:MAG: mucoidy inhibitor MuiA family protein [Myxococcales bacterium]|nr:mucoidy inhibitor MuiA family protein [Myxococcales bacterium]
MQISCPAEITHVTVHARGAVITRTVSAAALAALPSLPSDAELAGLSEVELLIPNITPLAFPGSLRVSLLDGGGRAGQPATSSRQVVSVRSSLDVSPHATQPGQAASELAERSRKVARLEAEQERLVQQRQRLAKTSPDPALRTTSFVEKVDERMADALATASLLLEAQQQIDRRIEIIERDLVAARLAKAEAELAYAQAQSSQRMGAGHPTRTAIVVLSGRGPLPPLALRYVVPAARFWPLYTLRIVEGADGTRRGAWLLEALLAQRSGEDWKQAQVSLSTADLLLDTRLPELPALRFGRAQPSAHRGYRPPPAGLDALFSDYDQTFAAAGSVRAGSGGVTLPSLDEEDLSASSITQKNLLLDAQSEVQLDHDEQEGSAMVSRPRREAPVKAKRSGAPRGRPVVPEPSSMDYAGAAPPPPSLEMPAVPASFAMAPPPAPLAAAPMRPQAAVGSIARSRSEVREELMKKEAPGGAASGGGGGFADTGADDDEATEPDSSDVSEQWLDFDRLVLIGPANRTQRGRLAPSEETDGQRLRSSAQAEIEALSPGSGLTDPLRGRGQFDYRYDSEGIVRIPSDGKTHRILLRSVECAPSLRLLSVPRERPEVYREAEFKNPLPTPLLAGPVDVYVEGSLLTTAQVGAIDRGGSLRVGMGVEERVRVARNVRGEEETTGLLGGTTQVTQHVSVEVSSSLGQPAVIELFDRMPVTDDKSMTVELIAARPEAKEYSQAERGLPIRGGLTWRLTLPAGGKAKVDYSYRIVFPAKNEIVGGNRRD